MDTDECVLGEPALLPNPPPGRVQGWGNKLFLWFGNSCRAWKGRKGAPRPREPDFLGRSPLATRRDSEPAPPSLRDPGVGRFGCASGPSLAANLTTPDSLRTTSEGGRGRGTWGAPLPRPPSRLPRKGPQGQPRARELTGHSQGWESRPREWGRLSCACLFIYHRFSFTPSFRPRDRQEAPENEDKSANQ